MKSSHGQYLIGLVEQALAGGEDPLNPPISVSKNGSLAKWRDKIQVLEIRVNDPGLKFSASILEETLKKTQNLGLEPIVTLPEFIPIQYEVPPQIWKSSITKPPSDKRVVFFKPCYLAIPKTVDNPKNFHSLQVEECLPIIELAAKYGTRKMIVPVSEPGLFIDPQAFEEFRKKFKHFFKIGKEKGISFFLRNGGITKDFFSRIKKETECSMAYNVGISHLERNNIAEYYESFKDSIGIVLLHQTLPGIDKFTSYKEGIQKAFKAYLVALKEFRRLKKNSEPKEMEQVISSLRHAFEKYQEASRNHFFNLGVFQNGGINLVPLLKSIKKDLDSGKEKILIFETVPNMKNSEFVSRYLLSDGLQSRL